MPRKNNTQQRLFSDVQGLPVNPTKAQRLAFIKQHNPKLAPQSVARLSSELKTLRHALVIANLIHVIGHGATEARTKGEGRFFARPRSRWHRAFVTGSPPDSVWSSRMKTS